jgi:hypothetical protein
LHNPHCHFAFQKLDIPAGFPGASRNFASLGVQRAGSINNVDESVSPAEVIEKLVPSTATQVGIWNQSGDIQHLNGNEPDSSAADCVAGVVLYAELSADTVNPHIGRARIRLDGREGIRTDFGRRSAGSVEECGFSARWLSNNTD